MKTLMPVIVRPQGIMHACFKTFLELLVDKKIALRRWGIGPEIIEGGQKEKKSPKKQTDAAQKGVKHVHNGAP
jgi:hypothetical protein